MKTIFMGTPNFALPILEALITSKDFKPIAVITSPNKPVGRKQEMTPPPVKVLAHTHNIPVLQPEKVRTPEAVQQIKDLQPDLIIVAAYGKIIPGDILQIPKYGCINVHGSLLPKYRGPSPIQAAILEGEKATGITIMVMDENMDTGPMLLQQEITLDSKETFQTLHDKLSQLGADLLLQALPQYVRGELKPQEQDNTLATYCQMITREDGQLIWNKNSEELERQIRAFTPWPGAFTFYHIQPNKRLKILNAEILPDHGEKIPLNPPLRKGESENDSPSEKSTLDSPFSAPGGSASGGEKEGRGILKKEPEYGKMIFEQNKVLVKTGNGWLSITRLQPEGGHIMTAQEFINGRKDMNGIILK